jgi:hypothetical protein
MSSMVSRAINCFSDGERGITELARIVSYAAAIDVFFSISRERSGEAFAVGAATATIRGHQSFNEAYELAKEIYNSEVEQYTTGWNRRSCGPPG